MRGRGVILATALIVGCADPAVDGAYEGQARFELDGLVCAIGRLDASTTAIGIAWMTLAPDATRLDTVGGEAHLVDAIALPADFHVPLFDAPPAGVTTPIRTVDGLFDVAIGVPVLFDDLDGDGTLARDVESVLGVGRGHLVLYSQPAASADVIAVPLEVEAMPTGWSVSKVICDDALRLTGLEVVPSSSRFDVWLNPGVIDNVVEGLAPATCLLPF